MTLEFKTGKDLDNFNKKYALNKETGCWDWIASKAWKGYGQFYLNGKTQQAHRIAFVNFKGPIPEGLQLDHLCRNRACINSSHLEPVSNAVNNRRGLQTGETTSSAKLTKVQVNEIREKYSTGNYSQKGLAAEYGISQQSVSFIVRKINWN